MIHDHGFRAVRLMVPPPGPTSPPLPTATVRRIVDQDRDRYRALRLRALRSDPMAFGSTWSRESAYSESLWTERTHQAATSSDVATWLAEIPRGDLVGMTGVFWETSSYVVWGMWVDPRYRGTGIGGRLLDEALRWTALARPKAVVRLSVNPTQEAAVRLYLKRGFRRTGTVEPLAHAPGTIIEEMARPPDSGRTPVLP